MQCPSELQWSTYQAPDASKACNEVIQCHQFIFNTILNLGLQLYLKSGRRSKGTAQWLRPSDHRERHAPLIPILIGMVADVIQIIPYRISIDYLDGLIMAT